MIRRPLAVLAGALLLAGALSACATDSGSGGSTSAMTPSPTTAETQELEVSAAWLDGGRLIGLVTYGSSTCVPVADEPTLDGDTLKVSFVEPDAATACTMDYVPRVTLVGVPEGVDPSKELKIEVSGDGYAGDADLDGVVGLTAGGETDYAPSAGWTDEDGQFVILTWGSSGCVPVIDSVEATGDAQVTVTFVEPAADQVCTADMAPRAQVAAIDGFETGDEVSLVLAGGGAEFATPVTVPIYGTP